MPPLPGEERLLTVFADIHYYFSAPSPRPLHHRFDKGSYFYIYHNSTRQTSRLEVANNPGTPEQDAFNGYLNTVLLQYSFKFPTLLTIVVDSQELGPVHSPGGPPPGRDPQEWRLSSADPRDQGQNKYRLHTLDVYFWLQEDAKLVVDVARKILHQSQLDFLDSPRSSSRTHDDVSPVVQQLEKIAISDPAFRNGQTRNSQNQAVQTSFAPPPPPPQQPHSDSTPSSASSPHHSNTGRADSAKPTDRVQDFTPIAYNPAAPAAPEPIAHREDTPPPADASDGTGLAAAAVADQHPGYGGQQNQGYTGFPGPVPSATGHYGSPPPPGIPGTFGSPPPPQNLQHKPSTSSNPSSYLPGPPGSAPPNRQPSVSQSFAPPPQDPNAYRYGGMVSPALQSPGTQIYGSSPFGQSHHPQHHIQPQYADYLQSRPAPPPGGYSQYSYEQTQNAPSSTGQYDVHNQVYRPTESEVNKSHKKPATGGQKPGKLEERADRVEKGVNRFLKKLEKRL